jgi:hypothetical protein
LQGSIAQRSDNDPFRFAGGLNGGVKVSGGDSLTPSRNEIRHLPGARPSIFAITQIAICNEFKALCELLRVSGKLRLCRPFFGQRQFFANGDQDCNKPVCSMLT